MIRHPATMVGVLLAGLAWTAPVVPADDAAPAAFSPRHLDGLNLEAVCQSVRHQTTLFGDRHPSGAAHLAAMEALRRQHGDLSALKARVAAGEADALAEAESLWTAVRTALLANPLLDFEDLLVKRGTPFFLHNFSVHSVLANTDRTNNALVRISHPRARTPEIDTLHAPGPAVRDLHLDFDGGRLLYSSLDPRGRWAVFEWSMRGNNAVQVSPADLPDTDWFQGIYLPDGRILLSSTASYGALDCVSGSQPMSDFYLLDRTTGGIRQLTFDQVHPNYPAVMPDGRVLYQRWEYSDLPHYFSRFLFTMNPDGTGQIAQYGSGSYFPTAFLHARPMPGHPRKIIGILSGHHGEGEVGRLAILDPGLARGYPLRHDPETKEWDLTPRGVNAGVEWRTQVFPAEQTGWVQEIPGRGRPVAGHVRDVKIDHVWPKFAHPWPLSEDYVLVAMKPGPGSRWGIYLADVFDNLTPIIELPGADLTEPVPLCARPRPPSIPDRTDPAKDTATVLVQDVYEGPGLAGVPRGTVERLRIFAYHFSYNRTGEHNSLGVEGPWDVRRLLGTVPVEKDGSALFTIPANTPISIQPLDGEGRALQLMRSWMVGMPGERVSCVGCHEPMNTAPPTRMPLAARGAPRPPEPWRGPPRPYSFVTEVQPVLDRFCVGCHDGTDGRMSLREPRPESHPYSYNEAVSYSHLHPYVRRPGPESDLRMRTPMEFHADTSPLIRMLRKGHHGVELDAEAWDRLYTWIDLNAPYSGRWNPPGWQGRDQAQRRRELAERFGAPQPDPESEALALLKQYRETPRPEPVLPEPPPPVESDGLVADGYPFDETAAAQRQAQAGGAETMELELAPGLTLRLRRIPAGAFIMGAQDGASDERPRVTVQIDQPFWMGETEISNALYALFNPDHDTGYHDMHGKDQMVPGWIGNHRDQPVARVSWNEAMAFCDWLSARTGLRVTLPTEAQWEWAARAGRDARFYFGGAEADFSRHANLADASRDGAWTLREPRFNDGARVTHYVGRYAPNAWGLRDMIGNVSEWTRTAYRPYPYQETDGRNAPAEDGKKVARGGSWHDRPRDAGAAVRFAYAPWQKVFDVGFRIIVEDAAVPAIAARPGRETAP
jgi:formylglycine-generating enzyme required for sulfatase activity